MYKVAFLFVLIFAELCSFAYAQDKNCPIKNNYSVGLDGCYHRNLPAVLNGCLARRNDCGHAASPGAASAANLPYTLATPSQVTAALVCDIAAAAHKKGQAVDISKALITASLTFSLTNKASTGASLTVGAIPVFTGATIAPSLSLTSIKGETTTATTSIVVDPTALQTCAYSSPNDWLTSEAVTKSVPVGVTVAQITESIQYIVTTQGSAGLKLAIVPISIGPQMSNETPGSKPDPAKCSSAPGGGGGGGAGNQ